MLLGQANAYINAQEYTKSKIALEAIFLDFPEDKEALLNLANLYLITKEVAKVKASYYRYAKTAQDSITAFNGIALANHIGGDDKAALQVAHLNRNKVRQFNDFELTEHTYNRYVQALIWNRKFVTARKLIDSLNTAHPNRNWILALRATLGLYTGSPKKSVTHYNTIIAKDSSSFDANLGKANALFAAGRINEAYKAAQTTLDYYPQQKDAVQFIEKLDQMHTPTVEEQAGYTFDNGNNTAVFSATTAVLPLSTKFRTTLSYGYRDTQNTVTGSNATTHLVLGGLEYKVLPKTTLKTVLGISKASFMEESYTQPILDAQLLVQSFKLQNLSLGYQRQVQNFNAALIGLEIVQNNYSLTYNLGTNFGLGWYTQAIHTTQSDANTRDLLFSSLYYTVFKKPSLKLGVNYQYISFKNQVPTLYFSPESYQAVEFFSDFRTTISKKTKFMASTALGKQQVEETAFMPIFRAETALDYQFSRRLSANLYGKYSTIASATAVGFEFTEIGFKLKWMFLEKPVF